MGDYSLNAFSFNKGKTEYKGNKKPTFDLTKFDGVSKDELIRKAGGANTQQGKLIESIFNKYDGVNGDGILTANEFTKLQADLESFSGRDYNLGGRELGRFNEKIFGVHKNDYSMDDLQAIIGMMLEEDNVTTDANGNILVTTHEEGGTKISSFSQDENNNLRLLNDKVTNGNTTTVSTYGNDGKTVVSKFRVTGTVTEELDAANDDRVIKKTTDKGSGGKEVVKYSYNSDGTVTEITYMDGDTRPLKLIVKDNNEKDKVIKTVEFSYEDGMSKETIAVDNEEAIVINRDADGNVIPETPKSVEYEVGKGEVWYNIVREKYGVTDHKTIMNIVHQLKDVAGVSYSQISMPSTITLPGEIKVGNESFTLQGVEKTDETSQTVTLDPNPPIQRVTPPDVMSLPPFEEPTNDSPEVAQSLMVTNLEMAGKTVTNSDGTKTEYDEEGRLRHTYDALGREIYSVVHFDDGRPDFYCESLYDEHGNNTRRIFRHFDGSVSEVTDSAYDDKGNEIIYVNRGKDNDGYYLNIFTSYVYDDKNERIRTIERNEDGTIESFEDYEYDDSGESLRDIMRNGDGSLDYYVNWNPSLEYRNPDGTLRKD